MTNTHTWQSSTLSLTDLKAQHVSSVSQPDLGLVAGKNTRTNWTIQSLHYIIVTVGEQQLQYQLQSSFVRDLRAIYNQHLNVSQHVHSVYRIGYYHLKSIGIIQRYLTINAKMTFVPAFVTSRLDYYSNLLLKIFIAPMHLKFTILIFNCILRV